MIGMGSFIMFRIMACPCEHLLNTTNHCDNLYDESQELVAQTLEQMEKWRKDLE